MLALVCLKDKGGLSIAILVAHIASHRMISLTRYDTQ
jgi:hypothetical protein